MSNWRKNVKTKLADYGHKFKCAYCEDELDINEVTFDHIIPRAKGGSCNIGNLAVSCKSCNWDKGITSPDIYMEDNNLSYIPTLQELREGAYRDKLLKETGL